MNGPIRIENIDADLLDAQRLALVRVIDAAIAGKQASPEDIELVEGIQNMLDHWSDEREAGRGGGERIVGAAIKRGDLIMFCPVPAMHHTVMRAMVDNSACEVLPSGVCKASGEQGFVTSCGRFAGRKEALGIAIGAGQLRAREAHAPSFGLFSEDLWGAGRVPEAWGEESEMLWGRWAASDETPT